MRNTLVAVCCCLVTPALGQEPPQVIPGWGTVTDPENDCRITLAKETLTIALPAKLNDLHPRNGTISAPRVLQEVTGDFAVRVRVIGAFQPDKRTTAASSHPFNGAGLFIWASDDYYIRLERNVWLQNGKAHSYKPLLEVFQNGKHESKTFPGDASYFKTPSTLFSIARQGDQLAAYISQDGKEWTLVRTLTVKLPKTVRVGVAAVNTSDQPMTAQFDHYDLRTGTATP